MFPLAASRNVRLVALNLRDYPGSTPYTAAELEVLCGSDSNKQEAAVRAQGLEIAAFLKHLIVSEALPPVAETGGQKTGGVALLSWSLGNIWPLSMLGNWNHVHPETQSLLQRSLRTLMLFGEHLRIAVWRS